MHFEAVAFSAPPAKWLRNFVPITQHRLLFAYLLAAQPRPNYGDGVDGATLGIWCRVDVSIGQDDRGWSLRVLLDREDDTFRYDEYVFVCEGYVGGDVMENFRRGIIGILEATYGILIVCVTIASGVAGAFVGRLIDVMSGSGGAGALVGFSIGALIGFFVSAMMAAVFWLLVDIAANTRPTSASLEGTDGARLTRASARVGGDELPDSVPSAEGETLSDVETINLKSSAVIELTSEANGILEKAGLDGWEVYVKGKQIVISKGSVEKRFNSNYDVVNFGRIEGYV